LTKIVEDKITKKSKGEEISAKNTARRKSKKIGEWGRYKGEIFPQPLSTMEEKMSMG